MKCTMNRREVLKLGLGAASLPAVLSATRAASAPAMPNLSAKAPTAPVAIQRCESFEPRLLRAAYDQMFDSIGGIGELVRNKTVTIKVNLTGMSWDPLFGMPAYETYQTHPNTVAALCAALDDAGAKRMVIVESLYWRDPLKDTLQKSGWDVADIESAGGHKVLIEDTRNRGTFSDYSRFEVPWGGYIYPAFDLNARYEQTDVLISLAKLKNHACAGITATIKNLFGVPPCSIYGNDAPGEDARSHRTEMFHSGNKSVADGHPQELEHGLPKHWRFRVPRITADIFGALPIDLGIVDGIRTIKGGEGHWNPGVKLVEPKLLIAGRNGVCTDAVCTAVMGYDPKAAHGQSPFRGDNHLQLLADGGIGTNDIERIEVCGVPIEEALHPFGPLPS